MYSVCIGKYVAIRRNDGGVSPRNTVWLVFFTVSAGEVPVPQRTVRSVVSNPTVAVTHEVSVKASLLLQTSKVTGSRHQFSDRIESKRGNQASHV